MRNQADRNREDQELDWGENALNQGPDRLVAADALFGRVETDWVSLSETCAFIWLYPSPLETPM
jgi:hypothetical protein